MLTPSDIAHKNSPPPPFFFLLFLIQLGLCFGSFPYISRRSTYTGLWLFSDKMVTHYDSKHEKFQPKCHAQQLAKTAPQHGQNTPACQARGSAYAACQKLLQSVRCYDRTNPVSHSLLLLCNFRWPGSCDIHRRSANSNHADRGCDSYGLQ